MEQLLWQWLNYREEGAIDDAFFDNECPHFFAVDWHEDDGDVVQFCSDCLVDDSLQCEWRGERLVVSRDGNETAVPLASNEGDRDVTIRTLNDVLQPDYEIRLLVSSHGSDTAGFVVLASDEWQSLDSTLSQAVDENFVKLALLPNKFTDMTDDDLPEAARARFQRMLERNRKPQPQRPWWRFW